MIGLAQHFTLQSFFRAGIECITSERGAADPPANTIFAIQPPLIGTDTLSLDRKDIAILAELTANARVSHTDLSNRIGLSSTALARRQKALEDKGYIKGYQASLNLAAFGLGTTVLVKISLESQSEEALKAFELEVIKCPSVVSCFLMSGTDDYILIVMAHDIADFERIHRTELSRLPRVARVQSSFALRDVVDRAVPKIIFAELHR